MQSGISRGSRSGRGYLRASVFGLTVAALAAPALADPLVGLSRNSYGMPGLVDLPSAEMRPDGELGVAITALQDGTFRNTLTFQIAPRLIGAFRYSRVPDLMPVTGMPGQYEALFDRSFDIRYQLIEEGARMPAVAVGLNDFMGTSVYSAEYIVATKHFGPKLTVTGGLGWGRLGSSGAIGAFGDRPAYDYASRGGEFNSSMWFKGDYAPFLGLSYAFNDKLTLKAEYSPDAYTQETALGGFDRRTAINFGADYRLSQNFGLQLFVLHGERIGFQISRDIDPKASPFPSGIEPAPLPVRPRPAPSVDVAGWSGAWVADPTAQPAIQGVLAQALTKDGQVLESMSLSKDRAELRVRNETYGAQPQAIGHAARVATRALPSSVETITITSMEKGMAVSSVTFKRSDLERLENTGAGEILARTTIAAARPDPSQVATEGLYPRLQWSFKPYAELSYFDPDSPLRGDVGVSLKGVLEFDHGFVLAGELRQKVAGNLDDSRRVSNSVVPHVRSDLAQYQRHGDLALNNLTFSHYGKLSPNLYSRLSLGYLERMYGGVSGEILWKPVDSRLALGLETNWVKQRDFDQRLGFRDYEVATGHASAYYDFGKGYLGQMDVGRYLAEDWGATLTLEREFANGWRVGAFATVTDMSSAEFGEGSFDKGIRIQMPIAWATGKPSRNTLPITLRPLVRDGGARLNVDKRLFETVRSGHMGPMYDNWGKFWR